jgi:hypothetical protein
VDLCRSAKTYRTDSETNQGNKYQIAGYNGDGNEYNQYLDLFNKEFILRFKRACLREKELLSKSNGLEIGVITEFVTPNELRFYLHFSNVSDQQPITNLKLKPISSRNNRIEVLKNSISTIGIGQQIKSAVHVTVKHYPIGYIALSC